MTKILIVRFSSIGDIVLTTPVIRCLRNHFPNAEIHYLTKVQFKEILQENPYINKIHTIEKEIDEVIENLKRENYNYIIDLHKNLRTSRLKSKLKAKSFTFPKKNIQKYLLTNFKINRMPKVHIVERYFKAVEALGVKNDQKGIDYFLKEEDKVGELPTRYVAIAVGAKFQTKQIPQHKLEEVIGKLGETPVILLGGNDDSKIGEALSGKFQNVISYCGKLSLSQSAFVLSKSNTVLTGDTGLMHIASAFNKPIVTVWGNTTPDFGMYPYLPKNDDLCRLHEVEVRCRPCSKIGYKKCPKGHFKCMEEQDEAAIVKDIKEFLGA